MDALPGRNPASVFPRSIRRILGELPKTLDETYERMMDVDEKKQAYANRLF